MDIVESVTGTFTKIGSWMTTQIGDLTQVFYNPESGLTFLGVLAVCGLGFGVIFLLIHLIQNFLHFRG